MERTNNRNTDYIIEKRFLAEITAAELIRRIVKVHIKKEDKKGAES